MQTPMQHDMQHCITVGLDERSYPIYIGRDLFAQLARLLPQLPNQILIVTNQIVAPLYLEAVQQALSERRLVTHVIGDGEAEKSLHNYQQIMDTLISHNFNRDCAVIALGGGVVGDLAGFVAATFQRGVRFYQIPTTLLAQVDSSVGGKTAVNHPGGKNLIGAFYQPQAVVIDTDCLATLTDRDYACGLAEVIKYGIIHDAEFFSWLEAHSQDLIAREPQAVAYAVRRSCQIKAEIVAADEREQNQRALLNLGHTFGHAIEATHYDSWHHGEAVAAGTVVAAEFMRQQGELAEQDAQRIKALLQACNLPVIAPKMPLSQWQDYMQRDKKVKAGQLRLVLPTAIGAACLRTITDWDSVASAINSCSEHH